jgi:hypothetical protein
MIGIWNVPTHASSFGLGVMVWDILVFLAVSSCTVGAAIRNHKAWPEYRVVILSMVFLTLYVTSKFSNSIR